MKCPPESLRAVWPGEEQGEGSAGEVDERCCAGHAHEGEGQLWREGTDLRGKSSEQRRKGGVVVFNQGQLCHSPSPTPRTAGNV